MAVGVLPVLSGLKCAELTDVGREPFPGVWECQRGVDGGGAVGDAVFEHEGEQVLPGGKSPIERGRANAGPPRDLGHRGLYTQLCERGTRRVRNSCAVACGIGAQ